MKYMMHTYRSDKNKTKRGMRQI